MYTEEDWKNLAELYERTQLVRYGRPDEYQYHFNRLTEFMAQLLLKPWVEEQKKASQAQIEKKEEGKVD